MGYGLVASLYIVLSGKLARGLADGAEALAAIEQHKGLGFVLVTSIGLFFGARWAMNRLLEEELRCARDRERLLAAERRALAGLFVSSLAHDANNLALVAVSALDEIAREPAVDAELRELATSGRDAVQRLTGYFSELKAMGRGDDGRRPSDVAAGVQRILELLRGHSHVKRASLTVEAPPSLTWPVRRGLIEQALVNLVLNAAEATGGTGRVLVRVEEQGDTLRLEVHDDGPGLDDAVRARLFQAFVTTKPEGTGLGLLSVQEAARAHGGEAAYRRSERLGGACFAVTIPREGGDGAQPTDAK
jgi:two-component system sensor histidine kinase HydH